MTLISILLKSSILLLAAVLTNALFGRRLSAATRHLIWTLAVAGLLLLPVFSFLLPSWTAFTTPSSIAFSPETTGQSLSSSRQEAAEVQAPLNAQAERSSAPAISARIPWSGVPAVVYVMGVFVLLVRLVIERMRVQLLVRRGTEVADPQWKHLLQECAERMDVRRTIRLLRSREETMPMALGIWHGTIVIPAIADTWSEDRRRAVLLHEMSHLIRHDCLSQLLAAVACALYWVHPGAWWIARRLRIERELACDDRVLSLGADAREYAGHLLELAYSLRSGRTAALAVSMAGTGQLEGRMLALLDTARNRAVPALRSHLGGLAVLIVLLVPLAAATISGQQATGTAEPGHRNLISSPTTVKAAQVPAGPVRFEMASIQRNFSRTNDTVARRNVLNPGFVNILPGGRLNAGWAVLRALIQQAYGLQPFQVGEGPDWLDTEHYDIEAKASSSTSSEQMLIMLRSLLEERFKLKVHHETIDLPAYIVSAAGNGLKLQPPKEGGCLGPGQLPPPPPPPGSPWWMPPLCGRAQVSLISATEARLTAGNVSMAQWTADLSNILGVPVIDKTGFTRRFDIDVAFLPTKALAGIRASGTPPRPADEDSRSIFAAIEDRLGLKLELTEGPMDFLVIDSVEKAASN